jgi:enoyl-CoA hydratase/carnithine racemase
MPHATSHIPSVRYASEGGIATLTIDQPSKMNAMTFEMWTSMPQLIARAEADPAVRAIAVTGAKSRAFCAGADISEFGAKRTGEAAAAAYDKAVVAAETALAGAAKPTIAVISGICFGGGFGIAMCCDLRITAADSRFQVPAARLALGYGYDGIAKLVGKLGVGPVADLLLTARIIDAQEASRLGIVNSVFAKETFEAAVATYLGRIAANAPLTLLAVKRALIEIARPEADRDISAVNALVAACFASADYREGQAAFREKRTPAFTGK